MAFYLTGADTVTVNQGNTSRTLADFPNGDIGIVSIPNESNTTMIGKNGNGIIAFNAEGALGELDLRILTGSGDDKFFNSIIAAYQNDPAGFVLISGIFIKLLGDGKGNLIRKTYNFSGGVVTKMPDTKFNISGDTEQAISTYKIRYALTQINFN